MAATDRTGLEIRRVPLADLHLDPANARSHGPRNMAAIKGSLVRFGQVEPLVVQRGTGKIIGGNGRFLAMRELGWTHCSVVAVDENELGATALGLALNRSAELAEWNEPALGRLLEQLRAEDGLEGIGFTGQEVDELLSQLEKALEPHDVDDPGPQEPPAEPVTRLGDLWLLGEHRLQCGDSTKPEDMVRLMNGAKAHLLATDPPYLVDYDGTNHPSEHHVKAGRRAAPGKQVGNKHWDAYVDPETSVDFFASFLRNALEHCVDRVPVYMWHATRRQVLVEDAWKRNGLLVHQTIVWAKPRGVLTHSHFLWSHEPCFYGWPEGKMPDKDRRPPPDTKTVWALDQSDEPKGIHPTIKPLAVFEGPIAWHTRNGEVVLEPFNGSGTQIVAAEKLGRRCYAMELAPGFVDAAIRRWQQATKSEARLEQTGATFAEIERERRAS